MTLYECLQCKANYCRAMSISYNAKNDQRMANFYKNAEIGFVRRLQKLSLKQAGIVIG